MIEHIQISHGANALRPVARQWVGQTFFGAMLRQAREVSLGPEDSPLTGGRGGKAFGSLLDQHLAGAASGGAGEQLVDAIVDRLAPAARDFSEKR